MVDSIDALRSLAATAQGVELVCQGRSMEPTLREGDRVRVRRAAPSIGDVVLFENHDRAGVTLHRVVLYLPLFHWFVHCGDAGGRGGAGIARTDRIIGRAELPRRMPPLRSIVAAGRALLLAAQRRF